MEIIRSTYRKNARIICDAEFEDMNYCTSKVTEPFLSFMEKKNLFLKLIRMRFV